MGYKIIKSYRDKRKTIILEAFGGCCGICGYNRFKNALDIHHLDPRLKEVEFSRSILSWEKTVKELRKCVLLCSNCHREVHGGIIDIPKDIKRFNEEYASYYEKEKRYCPICGKDITDKQKKQKTCSHECGEKIHVRGKIDWDKVDLKSLIKIKSIAKIAKEYNVVWTTVKRALNKRKIKV